MKSEELFHRMVAVARQWVTMNHFGALHIIIADGNVEEEHIEFCMSEEGITQEEHAFANMLLEEFSEEERHAIYSFTHCEDICL